MNRNIITELDEKRLDELLTYAPEYTEHNAENIKKLFLNKATVKQKTVSGKRIFIGALLAAVLVAVSGITIAAGLGVDFGRIYNSFFNNSEVEYKIEIGQSIESNGMVVTLLSAFTDGDRAHALVELSDLNANRLSDSIRILSSRYRYDFHGGPVSYDEIANTATLALTVILHEPMREGDSLSLPIDTILSGIEPIEGRPIDFDLSSHAHESESISQDAWNEAASSGVKTPGTAAYTGDSEPDIMLLPLNETAFSLDGIDCAIVTNIGIIDGYLHLQIKQTDAYDSNYNNGYFELLDSENNRTSSYFDISINGYRELVFEIPKGLSDYRLAITGEEIENVVHGPWNMSFVIDSEIPKKCLTAVPSASLYFSGIHVTCSPISTTIWLNCPEGFFGDGTLGILKTMHDYYLSFDVPYLTLTDGSVIQLEASVSSFDNTGGSAELESVYFDISKLNSITICGEEYFFA